METFEALRASGYKTPLDHVRRVIVFVVNSVSTPSTRWNQSENPPGKLAILMKAAGVPIDRYGNESVELLKDIDARWTLRRKIRDALIRSQSEDPSLSPVVHAPDADIYVINVFIDALKNKAERDYLNGLSSSFSLLREPVDRLRAAAATIILESPEAQQILKEGV
jgi:NTE family protein